MVLNLTCILGVDLLWQIRMEEEREEVNFTVLEGERRLELARERGQISTLFVLAPAAAEEGMEFSIVHGFGFHSW